MQNAMNIMAIVQSSNILKTTKNSNIMRMSKSSEAVKQEYGAPRKVLGDNPASFRKELSKAREELNKENDFNTKEAGSDTPKSIEKKFNKLAKTVTDKDIRTDIKQKPPSEALEQTDEANSETSLTTDDIQQVDPKDIKAAEEGPIKSVLDMLQQLLQMMEGLKAEGASTQQLADVKTELQSAVQKLEQVLGIPIIGQVKDLNPMLSSLSSDLTSLIKQLETVPENKLDVKEAEQFIGQLSEKLNQAKDQMQQIIQLLEKPIKTFEAVQLSTKLTEKTEVKEKAENINSAKEADAADKNSQMQAAIKTNASDSEVNKENSSSNNSSSKNESKEDGSSPLKTESKYGTNTDGEVKKTDVLNELNQKNFNTAAATQDDKLNFKLNIKQADTVLQKESFVKLSGSELVNQVIKKADVIIQGSRQEIVMKLEPESLGKLNLKLVVENGIVTAKFIAESQRVKEVLESSFNQLKDALQEKGIAVQGFSVSVGQQGAEFNSGQGFEQWRKSIKLTNKASGDYLQLDDEANSNINPYNYHEGKVDFKA